MNIIAIVLMILFGVFAFFVVIAFARATMWAKGLNLFTQEEGDQYNAIIEQHNRYEV